MKSFVKWNDGITTKMWLTWSHFHPEFCWQSTILLNSIKIQWYNKPVSDMSEVDLLNIFKNEWCVTSKSDYKTLFTEWLVAMFTMPLQTHIPCHKRKVQRCTIIWYLILLLEVANCNTLLKEGNENLAACQLHLLHFICLICESGTTLRYFLEEKKILHGNNSTYIQSIAVFNR